MPPTQRIFLPWDRPALPQAAGALVEHYGEGQGSAGGGRTGAGEPGAARMDGAVVVVPGARAGRRLKELLAEVAEGRGLRLVPPEVVTMGRLPELLFERRRPAALPAVLRLLWSEALRDAPPSELSILFARRPEADALAEWTALGGELAALARSVAAGGHRFRDVARSFQSSPLFDDAERWRVLARVQDRVERRLEELGLADPDLARMQALDEGRVATDRDLWLLGVSEMPGVVRRMLEASGAPLRALVHAPETEADRFDALGCVRIEAWQGAHLPLDEDRVVVCDRPHDQAEAVARTLAGLEGARSAEEISLGVPLPEVVPFLEQRLGRAGVPVRDAAGLPLWSTGPFRLLAAVASFLDDRRYDALAALVRHPDLAPWLRARAADEPALAHSDAWLTPLDRWYGEHLPARMVAPYPGQDADRGRAVRALMERLDDDLLRPDDPSRSLGGTRPLSGWAEPVLALLADVYGAHGLSESRRTDQPVLQALAALRDAAQAHAALPASLDRTVSAPEAIRLVLDEASGGRIPPEAEDAAVEMLGWLELHLDDAPVTVVTGVNEGALPRSVQGDPFLPDSLRARLGLEDDRLRHARDVYRMAAMLHASDELWLVVGRRTADGDPLRPSRLLFQADEETVARRVRRFYDLERAEGPDGGAVEETSGEGADGASAASRTSAFVLPPEPEIPLEAVRERISVTAFRSFLADPYTFALERVRGLRTLDDAAREMDGGLFGSVAHDVLERFGRSDAVHDPDPEAVAAALDVLLDEDVRRRFGSQARVTVRLQVEQLRARLRAFARWHASRIADGWRVAAVEVRTPPEGVPFDVDGTPVGLVARIDRVDHHPERGEWAVFDYKTGDAGKTPGQAHLRNWGRDWADLQLPLYHWLAPRLRGVDGAPLMGAPDGGAGGEGREGARDEASGGRPRVSVGYILLPRDLEAVGASMADWDTARLEEAVERARDVVRALRAGPAVFDPDRRPAWPDDDVEALVGRSVFLSDDDEEAR